MERMKDLVADGEGTDHAGGDEHGVVFHPEGVVLRSGGAFWCWKTAGAGAIIGSTEVVCLGGLRQSDGRMTRGLCRTLHGKDALPQVRRAAA